MEQAKSNPSNTADSIQNAPDPQNRGSRQSRQSRHSSFATPGPGPEFENPKENPCNCCCKLGPAAEILAILNLFYLMLEIVDMVVTQVPNPSPYNPLLYFTVQNWGLFYACMGPGVSLSIYTGYVILLTSFAASILVYFVATMGYMVTLLWGPGSRIELLCSKFFMWTSFGYAGFLLLFRLLLAIIDGGCEHHIWWKYVISSGLIIVFAIFNGMLARGIRNMAHRGSLSSQMPQGIVGEVPVTSILSVKESTPGNGQP